jgi:hypothetical protein
LVYDASGELDGGGKPAKNRAVSSAVAASELRAGAALNASTNAITTAAIVLGMATELFQLVVCEISQGETFNSGQGKIPLVDEPGADPWTTFRPHAIVFASLLPNPSSTIQ